MARSHRAIRHMGETHFSPARIWAMLLRYLYILRSSWPRTLELLYWPTLQMLIWGFMSQFLRGNSSYVAQAFGVLLGAVMLWDLLFRSQLGLSISFLEEMWARNLGQLFVTPLRPYEWLLSLLAMSFIRTTIGIVPAMLLAIPLYHFSIFDLGLPLVAFLIVLYFVGGDPLRQAFAFLLFRVFDIAKPPPIRQVDAALKNGVGVMVDDLLAAAYTLFVFALVVRLVGNG